MKKLKRLLAALCAAVLSVGIIQAAAYDRSDFSTIQWTNLDQGFSTVITDTQGEQHTFDGIPDTGALDTSPAAGAIASYRIYRDGTLLLETVPRAVETPDSLPAKQNGMFNGYYAVTFTISQEDNTRAFLTGLTGDNLEMVQTEMVSAVMKNSAFTMEHLDFIDAEKTDLPDDGDNELCWAASTACMLHYTGWGKAADPKLDTPDALLDLYVENFTDLGSNQLFGIDWFFNGLYRPQTWDGWSHLRDGYYGASGNYLPEYSAREVVHYLGTAGDYEKITQVVDGLERGCGVGFAIDWVNDNAERMGGHALTLWGYICDLDYDKTEREYYTALVASDSDSDMQANADRSAAPNKLRVMNMSPYDGGEYHSWSFDGYGGVLSEWNILEPYSAELPGETDPAATRDRTNTPNLCFRHESTYYLNLSTDPEERGWFDTFVEGQTIYVRPYVENDTGKALEEGFSCRVAVTDQATGEVVFTQDLDVPKGIQEYWCLEPDEIGQAAIPGLKPGTYTLTLTANPDHSVPEAYYYDNSISQEIFVLADDHIADDVDFRAALGDIYYDVENLGGAGVDVTFSCTGLEPLLEQLGSSAQISLMASFRVDGEWTTWRTVAESLESLEKTHPIVLKGDAVRFQMLVVNDTSPGYHFYSAELPVQYIQQGIQVDERNTGAYTGLARGAKSLAQGEQFAFTVTDCSTTEPAADRLCDVSVVAVSVLGEETTLYTQKDVLVPANGVSQPITVDSWDAVLSGPYRIYAVVDGPYCVRDVRLGNVCVQESPSFTVTTGYDVVDDTDGYTSLREAVAWLAAEPDRTITLEAGEIQLSEAIVIDRDVTIQGTRTLFLGNTTNFLVTESGSLTLDSVIFSSANGAQGGAICNQGGSVRLSRSRVIYNYASSGGGIYAQGGSVWLRDCSFKKNNADQGGAIALVDGAKLDMLNCNVFGNPNAIYVDKTSEANILYTAFTDNHGGAVASEGNANLFGCVAVQSGDTDLTGNVHVFGSFLSGAADSVTMDANTVIGTADQIYEDLDGTVAWGALDRGKLAGYTTTVTELADTGILLRNINGCLAYSLEGEVWTRTEVPEAFTAEELSRDSLGRRHGPLFGSIACAVELPYRDVTQEDWFYDAVCYVDENGLMNGTAKDRFEPQTSLTRGMMVTILYRMAGEPALEKPDAVSFTDVPANAYYHDAACWALQEGITDGYGNGRFGPGDYITREQMAVMLWRYSGKPAAKGDLSAFRDGEKTSDWAVDAMIWATQNDILNGKENDILDPRGDTTRAEAAQMLMNYLTNG